MHIKGPGDVGSQLFFRLKMFFGRLCYNNVIKCRSGIISLHNGHLDWLIIEVFFVINGEKENDILLVVRQEDN